MRNKPEIRVAEHEAAHGVAICDLGMSLTSICMESSTSGLTGCPIDAYCDYSCFPLAGESLKDTCTRKAIVGYVASAAEGAIYGESALTIIEAQDDDRDRVAQCVELLRAEGLSEADIREWKLDAWEKAQALAREKLPAIQSIARHLVDERVLTGDRVRDLMRNPKDSEQG
jgi:hypothetical protein